MTGATHQLEIAGLEAGYDGLRVLHGVGLGASGGELVVIAGANGAGKTTLLNTLMGTVRASAGTFTLDGESLLGMPIHERTRRGVALVPEGRGLFPSLTVWENLRVAARAARLDRDAATAGIERAVAHYPIIGERLTQQVRSLSGGEQQMVAMGRALLADPRVLLLDEPSMGLAPIIWSQVLDTCRRMADEGRIVLLVEQQVLEAVGKADRCVVLQRGRIVRDGPADAALLDDAELARTYFTAGSHT